jgi:RNA polymerase-binding transcription factor DksA
MSPVIPGDLLVTERHRLSAELTAFRAELGLTEPGSGLTELERYGQHPSDLASETIEREVELSIELDLSEQIREVDAALDRLDAGTYGLCESCGLPVDPERLAALPAVRRCEADQSTAERLADRRGRLDAPPALMEDATASDEEDDIGQETSNEELAIHVEPA